MKCRSYYIDGDDHDVQCDFEETVGGADVGGDGSDEAHDYIAENTAVTIKDKLYRVFDLPPSAGKTSDGTAILQRPKYTFWWLFSFVGGPIAI